jgi:hypothetical protein
MIPGSTPAYSGFRAGHIGQAYNEAAFRYFLAVDRRRAERSKRPLYLVLASLRKRPGANAQLTPQQTTVFFSALAGSVREVDFVGWFREGRVPAAVLAQSAGADCDPAVIRRRILSTLRTSLPKHRSGDVHVRVVRMGRGLLR